MKKIILQLLHSIKVRIFLILAIAFFLRIWQVTNVPPSPYWEEVAIGYDAYSILKTGKDHHGAFMPVVAFESFGDYKPSLYFYTVVLSEFLFGLNVFAVRLPAVLCGVAIVYMLGKIVQELQRLLTVKEKEFRYWSEITMIVGAVSPWLVLFSRAAWEVNLATALILAGVYFGLKNWTGIFSIKNLQTLKYFFFSVIFFVLSMYSYHSARIIAPFLGLLMASPLLRIWKTELVKMVKLFLIAVVLTIPLLLSLGKKESTQRLAETRAIPNVELVEISNRLIQEDGGTRLAKIIHHRWVFYGQLIVENVLKHFDLNFLFLSGDVNPRHSVQYFGQLYHIDLVFLFFGAGWLWRKNKKVLFFLFSWLIIGILPASITTAVPHALRTLPSAVVYHIVISAGIISLIGFIKIHMIQKIVKVLIVFIYLGEVIIFFHFYFNIYPKLYAKEWQYGYQEMVANVQEHAHENEQILISRELGRPAMYYWFYSQTDPMDVQKESENHLKFGKSNFEDQGEFLQFQNINFVTGVNGSEHGLIATTLKDVEKFSEATILDKVKDPSGNVIWVVLRN